MFNIDSEFHLPKNNINLVIILFFLKQSGYIDQSTILFVSWISSNCVFILTDRRSSNWEKRWEKIRVQLSLEIDVKRIIS